MTTKKSLLEKELDRYIVLQEKKFRLMNKVFILLVCLILLFMFYSCWIETNTIRGNKYTSPEIIEL